MLDQRGQLLRAAVGFARCSMPSYDRALWALRTWLDSWPGIGHVAVGMRAAKDMTFSSLSTMSAGRGRHEITLHGHRRLLPRMKLRANSITRTMVQCNAPSQVRS